MYKWIENDIDNLSNEIEVDKDKGVEDFAKSGLFNKKNMMNIFEKTFNKKRHAGYEKVGFNTLSIRVF